MYKIYVAKIPSLKHFPLAVFSAEPVKRKKKADVSVVIQRDAKRRRRLEKNIRKLEAKGKKLKPIEEIEGNRNVLKTLR